MECKGTFDYLNIHPITMEIVLYILSRDLLPCNQPSICKSINNP